MKTLLALGLGAVLVIGSPQLAPAQEKKDDAANKLARQGSEAAKAGNWDQAIEAFRKAADLDKKQAKNLAAALQQRGAVSMTQGNLPGAMTDFNEALRINPNDAGLHERRAYVEMKMGDYDRALKDYSEAIKENPDEVRYLNLRAYLYEVKGNYKSSMEDTEKVLKVDAQNAEAVSRRDRLKKIEQMAAQQQALTNATPIPAPPQPAATAKPKKP